MITTEAYLVMHIWYNLRLERLIRVAIFFIQVSFHSAYICRSDKKSAKFTFQDFIGAHFYVISAVYFY